MEEEVLNKSIIWRMMGKIVENKKCDFDSLTQLSNTLNTRSDHPNFVKMVKYLMGKNIIIVKKVIGRSHMIKIELTKLSWLSRESIDFHYSEVHIAQVNPAMIIKY